MDISRGGNSNSNSNNSINTISKSTIFPFPSRVEGFLECCVVNVITEICGYDKNTASVIFESKCLSNFTFMDDVNQILFESLQSQKISLQIETETLKRNSLPNIERCNVIMISSCSSFMRIYESLADNVLTQHSSPLLIILYDYYQFKFLNEIFSTLWRANIYKVNALLLNDDNTGVLVMSFFPFSGLQCNNTRPVLINQFINKSFIRPIQLFFPKKMRNLHQCPIRISTSNNSEPYIFAKKLSDENYELQGREIKLLHGLSEALNFSIMFTYIGREGVLLENGTAEGAYKTLLDGQSDIAIADMWLKANRLKFIDATDSYITSTIIFVIPPGAELTSFQKYFQPLDAYTWMFLLIIIALAFITIKTVKGLSIEIQEFLFGKNVQDPYLNVLVAVVGLSQPVLPRKNFARFMLMMFLLFCLVMRSLYQGSLYRFLQTNMRNKEVQSIDEMIERDYKFYLVPSILDLFEGQPRIYERKIVMPLEQRTLLFKKSLDPSFDGVFPRSLTGVMYSNQLNYNTSVYLICKEKFMTFSIVIYTRKGFFLLNALNDKIAQLQTAGLIDYWHSQIFDQRYLNIKESQEPKPTELHHLSGCFWLLIIGCTTGLVSFVCEILYAKIFARSPSSSKQK
ncbi:hypothetical protein PVAND_004069 [Polypedilum vanderplanki]|uniref:Ionotropic receptor n=1 Tax=Polypedilum vanderplanki TaxID=319348 RepID=A0A9J6BWH8_POLVA|nr:hypothetical protein PVAND_004069 [Polypedilum vanderplanki]